MSSTAAQDEFNALIASSTAAHTSSHPEDVHDSASRSAHSRDASPHNTTYRPSLRTTARAPPADGDAEDYDDDAHYSALGARSSSTAYYVPRASNTRGEGNTGPKGVIADARAFEREKLGGNDVYADQGEQEDDNDDDDEDGEAMIRRWKNARLAELKAQRMSRRERPGAGLGFGGLERVDGLGYLEVIEGESAGPKTVVVFVFGEARQQRQDEDEDDGASEEDDEREDKHNASLVFAQALAVLAAKYSSVRFIALSASEADMEPAGVPALLAYRDGELFARIVPLKDEVAVTSNVVSGLEKCLQSHDIV